MLLDEYINKAGSKYAVITEESFHRDSVARELSIAPRKLKVSGTDLVILSIEPAMIRKLVEYTEKVAHGVEFKLTLNSGKVTLLTEDEVITILKTSELPEA